MTRIAAFLLGLVLLAAVVPAGVGAARPQAGAAAATPPAPSGVPEIGVVRVDGRWIAVGDQGWATSPDGIAWTPLDRQSIGALASWKGGLVAVGGRSAATSMDGVHWTSVELPTHPNEDWEGYAMAVDVAAGPGGIVVIAHLEGDT